MVSLVLIWTTGWLWCHFQIVAITCLQTEVKTQAHENDVGVAPVTPEDTKNSCPLYIHLHLLGSREGGDGSQRKWGECLQRREQLGIDGVNETISAMQASHTSWHSHDQAPLGP